MGPRAGAPHPIEPVARARVHGRRRHRVHAAVVGLPLSCSADRRYHYGMLEPAAGSWALSTSLLYAICSASAPASAVNAPMAVLVARGHNS
jgi:hypothetical protein